MGKFKRRISKENRLKRQQTLDFIRAYVYNRTCAYEGKAEKAFTPLSIFGGNTMKTFMANAGNVSSQWYIVDAAGLPLGRVASQVAHILRGKHKPTYTPHVDTGDHVIVINAEKAILTAKKMDQKMYRHYSGYVGGLKEIPYRLLMEKKPELAMYEAIQGMLPKNALGRKMIKKLRVYRGSEHNHEAQQPLSLIHI